MGVVEKQWSGCYISKNLVKTYKTVVWELVAPHDPPIHDQNVWLLLKLSYCPKLTRIYRRS